jgi:hypothetical protein
MIRNLRSLLRWPGRLHRRLQHARPGSVLIMVVALLVLLALVGMTLVTTTRIDRYSTAQHASNTQIDLLLEGVVSMSTASLVDDLFNGPSTPTVSTYRQPGTTSEPSFYIHSDNETDDLWLASRWPSVPDASTAAGGASTTNWPQWRSITRLPGMTFETPWVPSWNATNIYSIRNDLRADYTRNPTSASPLATIQVSGAVRPAFVIGNNTFLAGDADGDGVADSGLFRLPVGTLNGVTYYAAVRIIDNAAAINATTAWTVGGADTFFTTQIGLLEALAGNSTVRTNQIDALNRYRFGYDDAAPGPFAANLNALTDQSTATPARTDFTFISQHDALYHQLARRIGNPGYNADLISVPAGQNEPYRAFSAADGLALAYRFVLRNSAGSPSVLEESLAQSLVASANAAPYSANDLVNWWADNFYMPIPRVDHARSLRSILVTHNAVSNSIPGLFVDRDGNGYVNDPPNPGMAPYTANADALAGPAKTNINTAPFEELWRAFYDVMRDGPLTIPPNYATAPSTVIAPNDPGWGPWRNAARDPGNNVVLSSNDMMQIRAAIAAVQAMDLRDADNDITSREIEIYTDPANPTTVKYRVMVYGTERQVYITEVIVHYDATGTLDYVAIELYNPHDTAIDLDNYTIATIDRQAGMSGALPIAHLSTPYSFPAGTSIPGSQTGGYLVIEEGTRPSAIADPAAAGANVIAVPGLLAAATAQLELVLLRPRHESNGNQLTSSTQAGNTYDETANLEDLVPVDMIDFTGTIAPDVGTERVWRYARGSGAGQEWKFTYPDTYNVGAAIRQSGWVSDDVPPSTALAPGDLGQGGGPSGSPPSFPAIQLANKDWAGWNKPTAASGNQFPFGAFARNGDILQVPFAGAYRIVSPTQAPGTVAALNSTTMDLTQVDDEDGSNNSSEFLGRFCPIGSPMATAAAAGGDFGNTPSNWRYRWAMDLFDYLTVQGATHDYLPNVDPNNTDPTTPGTPAPFATKKYPGAAPIPVRNGASTESDVLDPSTRNNEDTEPMHGLININTAPWYVLSTLPGISPDMARAIVHHRETVGPFRSIFELNRIPAYTAADIAGLTANTPAFKNLVGDPATIDFDDDRGDFSPLGAGTDGVVDDFEQHFGVMTVLSNLITTRSDSFTIYVVVQGWRNAGTSNATLEVERRAAIIVDRSKVTPTQKTLSTINVPVAQ